MVLFFLVNILPAVIAAIAAFYLIYLRLNRKLIMNRHKPGTIAHVKYTKLLNPYLLILALIALINFTIYALYKVYALGYHDVNVLLFTFTVMFVSLAVGLFVLYKWLYDGNRKA